MKSRSKGLARPLSAMLLRQGVRAAMRKTMGTVSRSACGMLLMACLSAADPNNAGCGTCHGEIPASIYLVGTSRVDITPDYPVRLNGFGFRRTESEGVTQRIWAKAIAIGTDADGPLVLISVDSLGVPLVLVDEVAARLEQQAGIRRERVAVVFSHSHTTPKVNGASDTIFSVPIPPAHQRNIDRYTAELTDALEQAALDALADRAPATLAWANGSVGFAKNRRTEGGPVDHSLPTLVARNLEGELRAIYVTYACHCVTLSDNRISGDWAGFAQAALEHDHPGAVAMVSIGCGSDANPPRGKPDDVALAAEQGAAIASEVKRLLLGEMRPISGTVTATYGQTWLPFNRLPERDDLEKLVEQGGPAGYNAGFQLARLDRDGALPTGINYPVQTWSFGDAITLLFLGGEVCVDYAIRLRTEYDPTRLWIHGYANDFSSYIPSERLLREGGYGGGAEIVYFALPATLQAGIEERIFTEVRRQIPPRYLRQVDAERTLGTRARTPSEAVKALRTHEDLEIDLIASEPLVVDPVAIDWGLDGRLWVCEMHDYPSGVDGGFEPGGRIAVLSDSDGDGQFDHREIFADGLPFPTEVLVWGQGIVVCAAPDILYLPDANGDSRADRREILFQGFATHNYQARVNSLRYGLDNWWYAANGLFGGTIQDASGGPPTDIGGRDMRLRFRPTTLQPVSGLTQFGRVRDDWGHWFGCNNGTLLQHYPLQEPFQSRNPLLATPAAAVVVPNDAGSNRLFPATEILTHKLTGPAGRPTSACGLEIYRDNLLGSDYYGNAFTCEPVNHLVHRLVLRRRGVTFSGHRAPREADREFLASTDRWFRPVQVRTGPDGCLWIVDMCRFVIEHPRWIPEESLAELDVRAGDDRGRIFRIRSRATAPRNVARFDTMTPASMVAALDSPNGYQRDRAQQLLVDRGHRDVVDGLTELLATSSPSATRLSALGTLDGLQAVTDAMLVAAMDDSHPGIRRFAIRLAAPRIASSPRLQEAVLAAADDSDRTVQMQVAYTLGEWFDKQSAAALAQLAWTSHDDEYMTAAVFSSVSSHNVADVSVAILGRASTSPPPPSVLDPLLSLSVELGAAENIRRVIAAVSAPAPDGYKMWQIRSASTLLDGLSRRQDTVPATDVAGLAGIAAEARQIADDAQASAADRGAAIRLVAFSSRHDDALADALSEWIRPHHPPEVTVAVIRAIGDTQYPRGGAVLVRGWNHFTPVVREHALDCLLARPATTRELLDAVIRGAIPRGHIDAARRQQIVHHADRSIGALAARAFAGPADPDRQSVITKYADVAKLTGDRRRGSKQFAAHCANCHRLGEVGHTVGPDLAALSYRTPAAMLASIFDPNREFDRRYENYIIVDHAGRMHSGLMLREDAASITLQSQQGREVQLLRNRLESIKASGKSLMPEGIEQDMAPRDVADLLEFLASQGRPRKVIDGNVPETVVLRPRELTLLPAASAEIYGGEIRFEQPHGNVGYWHGEADHIIWTLQVDVDCEVRVELEWASAESAAGSAFVIEGLGPPLRGRIASTGGYGVYETVEIGVATLTAGLHRVVVRADGPLATRNLMDLRGVNLVPVVAEGDR